jgi:hypothetical protein
MNNNKTNKKMIKLINKKTKINMIAIHPAVKIVYTMEKIDMFLLKYLLKLLLSRELKTFPKEYINQKL